MKNLHKFLILSFAGFLFLPACEFGEVCEVEAPSVKIASDNGDFLIDAYEASRSNATASTAGTGITLACNYKNTVPWYNATYDDARNACLDAGKRLCTKAEWIAACKQTYPYGSTYKSGTCNDTNGLESDPTGAHTGCKTSSGIYDMSGNVAEWVEGGFIMGGSYNSASGEVTCESMLDHSKDYATGYTSSGIGFRCCQDERLSGI